MPTPLFLLDRPLDAADFVTYRDELRQLQGNILKSHGRDETVSIFLTFRPGQVAAARTFLHALAPRVTSAQEQEDQTAKFKATGESDLFTGCWLSAEGYRFLGIGTSGFDFVFRGGARGAVKRLDDPAVDDWEPKFQEPIHALVTYAHSDVAVLEGELRTLQRTLAGVALVSWEFGHAMRNGSRTSEHFGFLDGISQPLFFSKDVLAAGSRGQWDPSAGPSLVLAKDPLGSNKDCGSYFVFRKLEQNVKRFRRRVRELAAALGVSVDTAGAMVMGRFTDGTPITMHGAPNSLRENDFNYRTDPAGSFCPFFSHIRKTNPRGATDERFPGERRHRIARRGITYGPPTPNGGDDSRWPEHGVAVLFQCCQAHPGNQFEFIQNLWVNQRNFIQAGVGQDTVAGQRRATRVSMPADRGHSGRVPFDFGEFIRMRGGEYFFAPSKSVLGRL